MLQTHYGQASLEIAFAYANTRFARKAAGFAGGH
jgi:hypothetical protein